MSAEWQDRTYGELSDNQPRLLKTNRELVLKLPEPSDSWALAETALCKGDMQRLKSVGAVEFVEHERVRVASERDDGGGNYDRKRWRTIPEVYAWVQSNLSDVPECPAEDCHATGVRNPRDADGYRCTNDECDAELTREQAEAIVG